MASVAASVRAGRTVVPHLLDEHAPTAHPAQPLTRQEASALRSLMRAVVTEGSASFLADLPGEVGAKTGTAEYGEAGPDGSLETHGWMVATRDDLAVSVFVETAASGSRTAGPLLEAFLSQP
jgi:cell division protein FtsI/penicillin-binding protein 2